MKIGKLAKKFSINVQTIRFYERKGLFTPAYREKSGQRIYDEKCLSKLEFILQTKKLGLSLNEIKELGELREKESVHYKDSISKKIRNKLEEISTKIQHLKELKGNLQKLISDT